MSNDKALIPVKIERDERNLYLFREEGGNLLIQATHTIFILKEVEKDVYSQIDGKKTVGDIAEMLSDKYDAPTLTIEKDVAAFLFQLKEKKLISLHES